MQEMVDFCQEKNIRPSIEVIGPERVKEVFEKLSGKSDAVIRYVLDVEKTFA